MLGPGPEDESLRLTSKICYKVLSWVVKIRDAHGQPLDANTVEELLTLL